ncbi:MAG: hypothetical protein JO314_02295, partial [Acidobacteria bacterium]|nr:hypothetical protein [Acidobacteriota bacterium]
GDEPQIRKAVAEGGMQNYWRLWITPPRNPTLFPHAEAYAQLGQIDKAIEALENALRLRQHEMTQLRVRPTLDPLRSDPRFAALLKRMHLD